MFPPSFPGLVGLVLQPGNGLGQVPEGTGSLLQVLKKSAAPQVLGYRPPAEVCDEGGSPGRNNRVT